MKDILNFRIYLFLKPLIQSSWKLISSLHHSDQVKRQRSKLIASRVKLVSVIFAMVTPLWVVVDWYALPYPAWAYLAVYRVICTFLFLLLIFYSSKSNSELFSLFLLVVLLAIPPGFYLASIPAIEAVPLDAKGEIYYSLFALLPLIVVAGLSVFPLTVFEVLLFSFPIFLVSVFGGWVGKELTLGEFINTSWMMLLIIGVSMISGMNQLHYMIELIKQASHDGLTGAYTRKTGTESIELLFRLSTMHETNFSIAYFDLDDFKKINDEFGHDKGDVALLTMTQQLQSHLRKGDMIIRWGGEEFIILLTNTNIEGAKTVVEKILKVGFGKRPDGKPLTASIGVAERVIDGAKDWPDLLEIADQRMYEAKRSGKARCILKDNAVILQKKD